MVKIKTSTQAAFRKPKFLEELDEENSIKLNANDGTLFNKEMSEKIKLYMEDHIKSLEEESKDSIEETLIQDIEKFQDTINELHTFKKATKEKA